MCIRNCALAFSLLALTACASKPKDPVSEPVKPGSASAGQPGASIEAKQVAAENEARYVAEISFKTGSSRLSPEAKKKVSDIVNEAKGKGKIDEFMVLSWADQEYPSVHSDPLPKAQRDLAGKRLESLKKFLEAATTDTKADVETFNMADRPNAIQNALSTTDARLKKSLEMAGIPNSDTTVKTPSKASKAIVMVVLEDNKD